MDNQSLKRLQACELEIFKDFLHACEKLDLTYYLLGGTLLGAVRHQGFIPWDDDIDVGMLRKDYDRFITEARAFLPEYYFIQTGHTDPEYPMNFAKIRDGRTTFVENGLRDKRINHGVYIDVFPLDYYPENSLIQKAFDFKKQDLFWTNSAGIRFASSTRQPNPFIPDAGEKICSTPLLS